MTEVSLPISARRNYRDFSETRELQLILGHKIHKKHRGSGKKLKSKIEKRFHAKDAKAAKR